MKAIEVLALLAIAASFLGCETTETASGGNQEQKRLAQMQREHQEYAQYDESDINLWNAHQDLLATGTNPAISYSQLAHH